MLISALNCEPAPKLLFYSENRVLRRLGDSEFEDGLGWNPDLLLRLGIKARPRSSFLFQPFSGSHSSVLSFLGSFTKALPSFDWFWPKEFPDNREKDRSEKNPEKGHPDHSCKHCCS